MQLNPAMAPTDGFWGDLSEEVMATVDTSSLSLGQHYMLIHGQNDEGDRRPFIAVFVNVVQEIGVPTPDIKADDSDGPVLITLSESLSVTIELDPGIHTGVKADCWAVADTPFGWYF